MEREQVETRLRQLLAGFNKGALPITPQARLFEDLGIKSLDFVVIREALERMFSVYIGDEDVHRLEVVSSIRDMLTEKLEDQLEGWSPTVEWASGPSGAPAPRTGGSSLGPDDTLYTEIEVGMPLTGRNNLAETPLLCEIGNLRWQHMSAVSGVLSKDVVDDNGERLYPTFFFAEVAFPPSRPMAAFGENDRFTIASTIRRFGLSILDGEHFLFPGHWPEEKKIPCPRREDALEMEVPYLPLSNNFVKQWCGAGWLKKSRPVHPGFQRIREMPEPPGSYGEAMRVKETQGFFEVPDTYLPLTPEHGVDLDYEIVPDRDLNGAGLLYFANYPMFLDIAERSMLRAADELTFDDELIDRRTLVHRKMAYFSNATSDDTLRINVKAWIESPFKANAPAPDMAPIRLILNYEMHRRSDDRLMLLSSAKKIVMGVSLGDTELLAKLASGLSPLPTEVFRSSRTTRSPVQPP